MTEKNYNELYSTYLLCRNCNRETSGIEDYKSSKTGKITKTCVKCRSCVLKSQAKKSDARPLTLKKQIAIMKIALKGLETQTIDELYEKQPRLKEIIG